MSRAGDAVTAEASPDVSGGTEQTAAVGAWREFCARLADAGASALAHPIVGDERDLAEGLRCLSRQLVFAVQSAVEFSDPDFPAFHRFDDDVTKWGGPNADNHYLRCAIDPAGLYRLTADVTGCREAILSLSEGDMQLGQYRVFGERALRDLRIEDGRLEVMIGPDPGDPATGAAKPDPDPGDPDAGAAKPADGGNWMITNPAVTRLGIRVYVNDWNRDAVPVFYIERLDRAGDRPQPLTVDRMAAALGEAASWVEGSVPFWLGFMEHRRTHFDDNSLRPASPAQGGADNIAYGGGFWNLGPEEALLVVFEPPAALSWSIQTNTWPWFESGDLAHAHTSINDLQAHVDPDNRVRAVISHRDPAVPNWIDTEGRQVGLCIYRWIGASTMPAAEASVVALAELASLLPADHPTVTPAQRRSQMETRRRGAHRRFRR